MQALAEHDITIQLRLAYLCEVSNAKVLCTFFLFTFNALPLSVK
jgi:hypothetical protein